MALEEVKLQNFRNLTKFSVKLNPHGNVFIANNGSGKTNFLEAIYYTIFGASFRATNNFSEYVKDQSAEFTKVELKWDGELIESVIGKQDEAFKRKFSLNTKTTSSKKLIGKFKIFLFAPHSVDLVNGAPSARRSDLDAFLSLVAPSYLDLLTQYDKVLKNRNALLKNIRSNYSDKKELEFWTEKLTTIANDIFKERFAFFKEINPFVKQVARKLYYKFEDLTVEYVPNIQAAEDNFYSTLLAKYSENIDKEIIVGKTLYGTHKDDFRIVFNSKDLKYEGSRGEQRIGSFIIKLAQYNYFLEKLDGIEKITFLIDDIFSELDSEHRERISDYLLEQEFQFIITGAEIKEFPKKLMDEANAIHL